MPFVVGMPAHNSSIEAALAFAGLTWNDVVKVEVPSFGATTDALLQSKIEVALVGTSSASTLQIANQSRSGIRWIPLPRSDKDGWKRFNEVLPDRFWGSTTDGPGLETAPYEGFSGSDSLDAYDLLSDDIAYFTTKAWAESYPLYGPKHPRNKPGSLDQVLDIVGHIPFAFHPGSIQYFKEIGRWTPELESWTKKVLDREVKLLKAWDDCQAEADATKVTADKLPALWDKYKKGVPPIM